MMLDWNEYQRSIIEKPGDMAGISPDIVRGYRTPGEAGKKTGALDAKTRELIALAVAVTVRCDAHLFHPCSGCL